MGGKVKGVYMVVDCITAHVQTNGKELSIETIQALKKMIKLAYNYKKPIPNKS